MNLAFTSPDSVNGFLWGAVFAALWVGVELVFATHLHAHYDLMQIVWMRYAIHLAAMLIWFNVRSPGLLKTRKPAIQLTRGSLMLIMPLSFALAIYPGTHTDAVLSIFWIAPFLLGGLAWVFLKEKPPILFWGLAAAGLIGADGVLGAPLPDSTLEVILALAMSASFSGYFVMTRTLRAERVEVSLFYTALVVFVLLTPRMPFVWITPDLHDVVVMCLIGVTGIFALLAVDRACHAAPVWCGTAGLLMQPAMMFVLTLVAGRHPSMRADLGAALLAAALVVGFVVCRTIDARKGVVADGA